MSGLIKKTLVVIKDALWILFRVALTFIRVLGVSVLVVLAAAFALTFALYGAGYFHELVEFAIEKYTSGYTKTECYVGKVEGTLLTGIDIYDFAIGDGPSLEEDGAALVIDEIHVRYNPVHFIQRDALIDRVHCVRPRLILKEDADGRLNLDRIFGPKGPSKGKGVYFEITNVFLEDADFKMEVGSPLSKFEHANIECTFTKARGAVFIDLRHCSCYLPEYGQDILHFGSGSLAINERLMHFSSVDATSHTTRLRVNGTIKFKPVTRLDLEFGADPLDFGEVLQGVFDDPPEVFGRGRYSGALTGLTDQLMQTGTLTVEDAYMYGYDVRDAFTYYEFDIAERQVRVGGFEGRVNETPVYAKMTLDFSGDRPVYWGEGRLLRVNLADYVESDFLDTDLDVKIQFSGSGVKPEDFGVDVSLLMGPGQLGPVVIDGGNADLRYTLAQVYISGLSLRLGGGDLFVKGNADPEALDLDIQARSVPVDRFGAGEEWDKLSGAVSVDGRITGNYQHPSFEGGVVFKDLAYEKIKCGVARAEGYWNDMGGDDRAEIRLMAWDVTAGPFTFTRAYGDMEAQDGVYYFHKGYVERGDGDTVHFDLTYDSRAGRFELTELLLDLGETEAELTEPLVVSKENDRAVLSGGVLTFSGGEFGLGGFFDPSGGPLDVTVEGRGIPLDELLPAGTGPELDGTLDEVFLEIAGTTQEPVFYANLSASNVFLNRQPIDYVNGEMSYEQGRLTIPGLVAGLAGGTLRAAAYIPISSLSGDGSDDEPLDVTIRFSKFKLAALTAFYKEGLAEGGYVDGVITATGPASSPTIRGNFLLSEARWGGVYFAKGRADFTYHEGIVSIREISLSETTLPNVVVTGTLPLSFDEAEDGTSTAEFELKVDFIDLDLRTLNPFTDEVLITGGEVRGSLELGGTYREPVFQGRVEIMDGEGVARSLRSSFSNLSGVVEARGDSVVVAADAPVTFGLDEGGGSVWGSVSFEGLRPLELDLTVSLENYVIRAIRGVQAQGDLEATIKGPVDQLRAQADVTLSSGLITIDFGGDSVGGGSTAGGLDYEVHVFAPGNLWLRNKDAEIELEADVTFRKTGAVTVYTGELNSRRGYYYFLQRDFTVEQADIVLTGTEELDPVINLRAKRVIRASRQGNPDAVVYIDVTGTLREPEINLSYELTTGQTVGLAQDEIMKVLALDVTWEDYNDLSSGELASKGSSDYVRHYAEAEVARAVRREVGVDVFEFDADVFRGEQENPYAEFTVGQHLTHDLFVSYTGRYREDVSGGRELEHAAEVDYELRRNFYVVGSTFEDEGSQRYGLGLRFIHKY